MPFDVNAVRACEFPLAARWAYFNHASDSPVPARAAKVIAERTALLQDPQLEVRAREDYLADAQQWLGEWLNAEPSQIAFLTNIVDSTATVVNGLEWRDGDEVLLVADEFASFALPWKILEREGVHVVVVPRVRGTIEPDQIEALVSLRTRVIAISDVEYQSGDRNDLADIGAIAKRNGALFVVDASQSLGALPIDVKANNIDVVAAVGYKWLMAPHGIATLYVSSDAMEHIRPSAPGRYSVVEGWETKDYALNWQPDARRYQGGALNWIGVTALSSSLSLLNEIGPENVARFARANADAIAAGLASLPVNVTSDLRPARRSQILAFSFGSPEADDAFVRFALQNGVVLGRRGLGIRVGAHFWNTAEEIARLLDLVATHGVNSQ
jgi:cysteine desulfurase / selenocysteine lyase